MNNYKVIPPKIKKNEKIRKKSFFSDAIENVNARFSVINDIDFGLRKIHMYEKWFSKIRNLMFWKILQNDTIKYELNNKNEIKIRKALRVFPAETRLTVYRRPRVRFGLNCLKVPTSSLGTLECKDWCHMKKRRMR